MIAAPVEKPPYRVPSMAEVGDVPWNGYDVVSTFSGCGGSCLGFRMAGFHVAYANEFVQAARDTYAANYPLVDLDPRDIRDVDASDILLRLGVDVGDVDVMEGSPPCASFSMAGKRSEKWGKVESYSDTKQRSDDLFFEFIRLVDGVRPKVFVAENVSGLVKGAAKGYFKLIRRAMLAAGYRVEARLLDAQWLGVPQARARVIFIGVREDLGVDPIFPAPLPYRYSIRDALPWIVSVEGANGYDRHADYDAGIPAATIQASRALNVWDNRNNLRRSIDEPAHAVLGTQPGTHGPHFVRDADEGDISRFAIGKEWERLQPGESSDRYFNLVKPHLDRPSPTVTQTGGVLGAASVVHPIERRKFTIAELRRICGFPDDFVLTGTYTQQWERLGRAVPPVMMFHVATAVRKVLDQCSR